MIETKECYFKDKCAKLQKLGVCEEPCLKLFKVEKLYDYAMLTPKQRRDIKWIVDKTAAGAKDEETYKRLATVYEKNIGSIVKNGANIYICSKNTGNGKTEWALRLLRAYLNSVWATTDMECRALFINVPRYFSELKGSFSKNNEYVDYVSENILTADLVVWDEVAVKSLTPFEQEQLLQLINNRIDNSKSNIYTSNYCDNELKSIVGDRLFSRIVYMSDVIEFFGGDKRGISV